MKRVVGKFITTAPANAGTVVAMAIYQDQVYVACQYEVYKLVDGVLVPLEFAVCES